MRLVAVGILTAVLVALLGYWPTVRMAGPGAVGAMLVGIAASLLAGLVGAVPVGRRGDLGPCSGPAAGAVGGGHRRLRRSPLCGR